VGIILMKKPIDEIRPDPRNKELFGAIPGNEFKELVESVKAHGLINPITITAEGLIIAGEQRWRAAKKAGIAECRGYGSQDYF